MYPPEPPKKLTHKEYIYNSSLMETMTEYEQDIYDVIADWWDVIFDINPPPVDRNGEYIDKHATIIDLVKGIKEVDAWNAPIPPGC